MINNPYNRYQQTQHTTMDQKKMILMLYDGAVNFLLQGKEKLRQGKFTEKGELLMRAFDIITELMNTLDKEKGGAIALSLESLYGYMLKRINHANANKDDAAIDEIVSHLKELRSAWAQIELPTAASEKPAERPVFQTAVF